MDGIGLLSLCPFSVIHCVDSAVDILENTASQMFHDTRYSILHKFHYSIPHHRSSSLRAKLVD
jgi:hypothetical protein